MNRRIEQAVHCSDASPSKRYTSLRNYIFWSTLTGIFSEGFFIQIPFHILLFYGIMLVNIFLILLLVDFMRIYVWMLCLVLYLAMSGCVGIVNGTDTIAQTTKELLGISVTLLYFHYFFRMIRNDFEHAFSTYAKIAFWFAIIALTMWAGTCIYFHRYERLRGLTSEPGAFCEIVLPAYYWYTYLYFASRKHGAKVLVFTLAILLSSSSLGYLCVAFGAMLLLSGRMKNLVAVPIVAGAVLALAYTASSDFRMRADDTLLALSTRDVTGANLSTFALISNVFVTQKVLEESPVIGNGLGSHPISHARFIGNVPGVESHIGDEWADSNATEAASLTLRALSELGILGFSGLLVFLFYFHAGGAGSRAGISNAILVCFFLKLIRDGNYFGPEQFFFIFIYILNHRQYKLEGRSIARRASSRLSMRPLGTCFSSGSQQ